ncbi:MAG TPA: SMI1/KNR4 family protein [Ktedonobacterales bacterium]|jgi:hypothetical protein
MRLYEDTLIEWLKVFVHSDVHPSGARRKRPSAPPVSEEEMRQAEAALGFTLPPLLRRLYLEVSNGDFGPGLLRLNDDPSSHRQSYPPSLVSWYVEYRSATQQYLDEWWGDEEEDRPMVCPEKLMKIADWGCNIYSCLDCTKEACPVLRNDNNISFRTFAIEAPSLHQWLEDWLDGKQLFWLDWDTAEKITFPLG